ncbi:helix-turn-helix domain-containing protein [Trichococcus sp.]|uniref:helix-turn-helix domain-containing protein n=1 Tax=Trichococcus sp. TaxID=1985464 RepID=UPI003C7A59F2
MENMMIEVDVLSMGYGTVGKLVMRDRDLTPEAKAIYAYISTYAGAGDTAYPSVDLICYDMNMGKDRFQKHKKCLIDKGYIVIQKYATAEGKFTNNLYVKKSTVMKEANATDKKATVIELPLPDFAAEANPAPASLTPVNLSANKNSVKNNNLKDFLEEDEDDSEFKLNEKTPPNDFAYWQEKWAAHFGTQLPFTRHIHEGLLQWAAYFGDSEIVLHAFAKAGRYGAKSYAYLDSILRNWWDEGLRTAEDVYDREIAERY